MTETRRPARPCIRSIWQLNESVRARSVGPPRPRRESVPRDSWLLRGPRDRRVASRRLRRGRRRVERGHREDCSPHGTQLPIDLGRPRVWIRKQPVRCRCARPRGVGAASPVLRAESARRRRPHGGNARARRAPLAPASAELGVSSAKTSCFAPGKSFAPQRTRRSRRGRREGRCSPRGGRENPPTSTQTTVCLGWPVCPSSTHLFRRPRTAPPASTSSRGRLRLVVPAPHDGVLQEMQSIPKRLMRE